MLGAAFKSACLFRRSAVRSVPRAGSSVLSPVKAAGGGGALACAAKPSAPHSALFATRSAVSPDFISAADDIVESFRKLGAGVTGGAALPFGDSSDALACMKRAGFMGSHVSVRRMSTASAGATGTSGPASGAAAREGAATGSKSTAGVNSKVPPPPFPMIILVKVGNGGRYLPFSADGLMGMNISELLDALASSKVFGQKLKKVDLSDCSVELFKLPASADEPSAADETLDKLKELKGAKTVGAMWSTIATADAAQLCIGVRLPADAAAAPSGLNGTDAHTLLASIQRILPPALMKRGDALFVPRSLTDGQHLLSGLQLGGVMASSATLPANFIKDLDAVRGSSLREIAARWTARAHERSNATTAEGQQNRLLNPLVALQSSPGGGKSTVLDCAALLCTHDLWRHFCSNNSMCNVLAASVPVTVTFNSGSDLNFNHADADTGTGLALRILHSFFAPKMRFRDFAALLPMGQTLDAVIAVDCCLAALPAAGPKRGIMLLVDEVIKLGDRATVLLSVVGTLLDNFPAHQFNAACTTLNAKPFIDMETGSKRPISWAPLPALPQQPAERMVCHALKLDALPRAVRVALSDCAGHPRSQQYVLEAAEALQRADPATWMADESKLLQSLRQSVVSRRPPQTGTWAVRAALEGCALSLDEPVPSAPAAERRSLRELIAAGIFLNTDVGFVHKVVPKMSLMTVLSLCSSGRLGAAAAELAAVEVRATASGMAGDSFEDFVARWLHLRLLLAAECGSSLTLKHLLLNPLQHEHPSLGNALPQELMGAELRVPDTVEVFRTELDLASFLESNTHCALQPNVIYTFGSANPGFDSLVLLDTSSGRVAVAFESRFSTLTSILVDDAATPNRKVQLWTQQMQLLVDKCGVATERCLLVYLAMRDVELGDMDHSAAYHRRQLEKLLALVLGRASAASLFTPSLSESALFTQATRVQKLPASCAVSLPLAATRATR